MREPSLAAVSASQSALQDVADYQPSKGANHNQVEDAGSKPLMSFWSQPFENPRLSNLNSGDNVQDECTTAMAEILALVASIVQVSSFGLKLSKTLHDYGAAVMGAEKRLAGLDRDIGFTSGVLSELDTLLNDSRVQALVSEQSIGLARDAVAECDGIFQAMEGVAANIRKNGLGKFKMYFRETKIELLRSNLDRMKGNLTLLMGVINHATQICAE